LNENIEVEKIIKNNKRFIGNEDLLKNFKTEVQKTLTELESITQNNGIPDSYLERIITTSMINVLKKKNRMYRSKTMKNIPKKYKTINYGILDYTPTVKPIEISEELSKVAAKTIKLIDKDFPEMEYLKLYELRYNEGYQLNELSKELGITEDEVAKKLFSLIDIVKKRL